MRLHQLRGGQPLGLLGALRAGVADNLHVVAVWVSNERALVARVVFGPEPRCVQDHGTRGDRASKKPSTAALLVAPKAMWHSRKPSPVSRGPIQNVGLPYNPNPITSPKSITRPAPSDASIAS